MISTNTIEIRRCSACKNEKELLFFSGNNNQCKECRRITSQKYRDNNREKCNLASKISEMKNPRWGKIHNLICKYCKSEFTATHKDKQFCSDSCAGKHNWHNGEKGKRQRQRWQTRINQRNIQIGNCALCGIHYDEIVTLKELGSKMFAGGSYFMKDHITPKSNGGNDSQENIRYLCWFCNLTRKDIDSKFDYAIKQAGISFWKHLKELYNNK